MWLKIGTRLRRKAERLSQLREARGQVGKDMGRRPVMTRRGAQRSGADQNSISACTQKCHQEPVRRIPSADHRAGRRVRAERHDAIERRDEIRVDGAFREAQVAVDPLDVCRQVVTRQLRLEQDVERFDQ